MGTALNNQDYFDGQIFKNIASKVSALSPLPQAYQNYFAEEKTFLEQDVKGAPHLLDAGTGFGRLIPDIAPHVTHFTGVDFSDVLLEQARGKEADFHNLSFVQGRLEDLSALFADNTFTHTMCVWNTLGNVNDDQAVLEEMATVTSEKILLSVHHKGTMDQRKKYYQSLDMHILDVDETAETVYLEGGALSRAYSKDEIQKMAENAGLKLKKTKILGGVLLGAVLIKR